MATYNVGNVEVAVVANAQEAISKLESLRVKIKSFSTILGGVKGNIDRVGNSSKKASTSLSNLFSIGKLYVFLNYTKRAAQSLARTVQSAIDYVETLNKFKVSMGDMYGRAVAFQNKMSEAYGLATIDLMNYQANFNNIVKGLGNIEPTVAYNMSETLTQMAVDFASLFNTSIDSAMTKFQSALTQQVRPIRSVSGFDITTGTLQSVLESLGIADRTVGQLNQVEKRLLIIIALQRQMKTVGAMGDFARTIEQPANQLKILSQQLKETGIALGNFALKYIAPALKYVLGFVMAVKAVITTLSALRGAEQDDSISSPLDNLEFSADDATGAVGKTTKAVKDLKKATTGIDELNIIQQPEATDSGDGGVGGGIGGIDPRISGALESYDTILGNVKMKATDIRDRIMEWLGFTKIINPETGEISWKLSDGETNLGKIVKWGKVILGIIGAIIGFKIAGKIFGLLTPIISIAKTIGRIFRFVKLIVTIATASELGGIVAVIGGIVILILGIKDLVEGIKLGDVEKKVTGILKIVSGIAFIVAGVALFIGAFPVAIGAAIVGAIALIAGLIYKFRDKIAEVFSNIWEKIKKTFSFLNPIIEFFKTVWENIKKTIKKVDEIRAKIREIIRALWKVFKMYILTPIKEAYDKAKAKFDKSVAFIKKMIKELFKYLWDKFKESWLYKNIVAPAVDWFSQKIQDIKDVFDWLVEKISNAFDWVKENIAKGIEWLVNLPIKGTQNIINFIIAGINLIIKALNKVPGIDIELLDPLELKTISLTGDSKSSGITKNNAPKGAMKYATGGFPTRGDYFLANENGIPEYVGSIGNRTAVANTNQIVQGISYGVSMAQLQLVALLKEQNALSREALVRGSGNVYMSGRKVSSEVDRNANARGVKLVKGSFSYGY